MNQNNGHTDTTRKKLELALGVPSMAKVLREKPFEGENRWGKFFLWTFEVDSEEVVFFPDKETHQTLHSLDLKPGDTISLTRSSNQNGKKTTSRVSVELLSRASNGKMEKLADVPSDDGFKELMRRCVQEAVEIVKEVNTISWQNEDVRSIALTIFIQRARA